MALRWKYNLKALITKYYFPVLVLLNYVLEKKTKLAICVVIYNMWI